MTKIAFLGLGAMGSRMAARLIAAGHDVTVWNRTPAATEPLAASGAKPATTPKEASSGAEVVIAMLRDDPASSAVWLDAQSGAFAGMESGALGIECSTLSPGHVRRLHEAAFARGVAFVDAPLAGSRPQADAGQLIFMAGGTDDAVARAEPVLLAMGAACHHAGGPGAGSVVKLMVNTLFAAQLAVLAELLGMAGRTGLDPARALDILGATPVASAAAKMSGGAMLAGAFAPAFPIDLVVKDMGLARAAGTGLGQAMPLATAVEAVFADAVAAGFGGDNITGIAQLYPAPMAKAAE